MRVTFLPTTCGSSFGSSGPLSRGTKSAVIPEDQKAIVDTLRVSPRSLLADTCSDPKLIANFRPSIEKKEPVFNQKWAGIVYVPIEYQEAIEDTIQSLLTVIKETGYDPNGEGANHWKNLHFIFGVNSIVNNEEKWIERLQLQISTKLNFDEMGTPFSFDIIAFNWDDELKSRSVNHALLRQTLLESEPSKIALKELHKRSSEWEKGKPVSIYAVSCDADVLHLSGAFSFFDKAISNNEIPPKLLTPGMLLPPPQQKYTECLPEPSRVWEGSGSITFSDIVRRGFSCVKKKRSCLVSPSPKGKPFSKEVLAPGESAWDISYLGGVLDCQSRALMASFHPRLSWAPEPLTGFKLDLYKEKLLICLSNQNNANTPTIEVGGVVQLLSPLGGADMGWIIKDVIKDGLGNIITLIIKARNEEKRIDITGESPNKVVRLDGESIEDPNSSILYMNHLNPGESVQYTTSEPYSDRDNRIAQLRYLSNVDWTACQFSSLVVWNGDETQAVVTGRVFRAEMGHQSDRNGKTDSFMTHKGVTGLRLERFSFEMVRNLEVMSMSHQMDSNFSSRVMTAIWGETLQNEPLREKFFFNLVKRLFNLYHPTSYLLAKALKSNNHVDYVLSFKDHITHEIKREKLTIAHQNEFYKYLFKVDFNTDVVGGSTEICGELMILINDFFDKNKTLLSRKYSKVPQFSKDIIGVLPELCKDMGRSYLEFLKTYISQNTPAKNLYLGPSKEEQEKEFRQINLL